MGRLKNGWGAESDYYIVSQAPREYGFGNQFRSLVGAMIVALSSGRKFRSRYFDPLLRSNVGRVV